MSKGTLVAEADVRSGALRLAAQTHRLGRQVGAVARSVTSPASVESHQLLIEGRADGVTDARAVADNQHCYRTLVPSAGCQTPPPGCPGDRRASPVRSRCPPCRPPRLHRQISIAKFAIARVSGEATALAEPGTPRETHLTSPVLDQAQRAVAAKCGRVRVFHLAQHQVVVTGESGNVLHQRGCQAKSLVSGGDGDAPDFGQAILRLASSNSRPDRLRSLTEGGLSSHFNDIPTRCRRLHQTAQVLSQS